MDILNQYALLKMQIKDLEDKLKLLAPDIKKKLESEEGLKLKQDYGTFSIVQRVRYEYSERIKELEKKLKEEKLIDVEEKRAIPSFTEELRFTPAKMTVPRGAYNFDKYDKKT